MSTPRSITPATPALALLALALLVLAACPVPPEVPQWKQCADGTVCPLDTACVGADRCLRCEAVRDLASWARCDDDMRCPTEAACDGSRAECLLDTCHAAGCGDGITARNIGEECDDGNTTDGDGCDSNCRVTDCGNGVKTAGEECDDGNHAGGDGCGVDCKLERDMPRRGDDQPDPAAGGAAPARGS